MPQLSSWRELARKAAQALRRQLAQTESGLSALLNPGRSPQSIPVPLPQRRAPRFPGDKRFYTQASRGSHLARPVPKSGTLAAFAKTEFGRISTRPRLSSGTVRSHGYGRSFSTAPINHAQVAREVYASISQGIRAGVLNAPFFPPPTTQTGRCAGGVMHGVQGHEDVQTRLTLPLAPPVIFPGSGRLSRSVVAEIGESLCATPQFLAKLRRDLTKLMRCGEFDYCLVPNDVTGNSAAIQVIFHGKDRDTVERFLRDVGVSSGTVTEERLGLLSDRGTRRDEEVFWPAVHHGDRQRADQQQQQRQHYRGRRGEKGRESMESLDRYVEAIDVHRYGGGGSTVVC